MYLKTYMIFCWSLYGDISLPFNLQSFVVGKITPSKNFIIWNFETIPYLKTNETMQLNVKSRIQLGYSCYELEHHLLLNIYRINVIFKFVIFLFFNFVQSVRKCRFSSTISTLYVQFIWRFFSISWFWSLMFVWSL